MGLFKWRKKKDDRETDEGKSGAEISEKNTPGQEKKGEKVAEEVIPTDEEPIPEDGVGVEPPLDEPEDREVSRVAVEETPKKQGFFAKPTAGLNKGRDKGGGRIEQSVYGNANRWGVSE